MKKVFHFVPAFDVGGVQVAIEKSLPELNQMLDISVFYVKRRGSMKVGQLPWWRSLGNFFVNKPDVVITSLWWAHPLGFLFKLAGIRWVCFIHNSRFAHFVDRFICTVSIWISDEVAADSIQAEAFVRAIKKKAHIHVIPYIFPLLQMVEVERIKNSFIFVGRNAKEKRMDLVVGFFRNLLSNFPFVTCRFVIAGDVPILVSDLMEEYGERVVTELNLSNSEALHRLCASEYFVVLSDFEGYCMTAYEAVQAGCFVIYRDVGAIKSYIFPNQSFEVKDLGDLHSQFDSVLAQRNEFLAVGIKMDGPKMQSSPSSTYTSCFMTLIENPSI